MDVHKARLVDAASEFAQYPGVQNDASVKDFLDQFPLPLIINVLQMKSDEPAVVITLVSCLERVFKTKHGASLIPDYMQFVQVGLTADSEAVKALSCKTVTSLLENSRGTNLSSTSLISEYNIYPLLLGCLVNGDEEVAASSMDAIKALAWLPEGMDIVFPASSDETTHLGNLASSCTSLGRVRVLALIVKLFSISSSVASVIFGRNLLALLEDEIRNAGDTLVTLSALELWYELSEVRHGTEILSRTTVLQLLVSIISDESRESILRSRAMAITGRLLSEDKMNSYFDENSVRLVISAIDGRLESSKTDDVNELESALEALGQIGSSSKGATLVLSSPIPAARHLTNAAFDRHGRGKQLAALHALGNLAGETRPENSVVLSSEAEETLKRLIYDAASKTLKLTPSGLFVSILQQEAEFRVAGYRVLSALVSRAWCLVEICSKQKIIDTITSPSTETSKIGMEVRYKCCKAVHEAFTSSKLLEDPALCGLATKLEDGVRRGPYLTRTQQRQQDVQPLVVTADRF